MARQSGNTELAGVHPEQVHVVRFVFEGNFSYPRYLHKYS